MPVPYIKYKTDSSITSIVELIKDPTFIWNGCVIDFNGAPVANNPFLSTSTQPDLYSFLSYDGGTGKINYQRIIENYTLTDKKNNSLLISATEDYLNLGFLDINSQDSFIDLIVSGTVILIPKTGANVSNLAGLLVNTVVDESNTLTFLDDQLVKLLQDPKYISATKYNVNNNDTVTELYPNISVWMWIRTLNKLINVTSFVESVSTSTSKAGGSFSLSMAPIEDIYGDELNMNLDQLLYEASVHHDSVSKVRTNFFFHNKINVNDLVFIKFEKLALEYDSGKTERLFEVPFNQLPNQVYDMIALVDSTKIVTSPESNDVSISIMGRDFMKLLTDDGDFIFPFLFTTGSTQFFYANTDADSDNLVKRNFHDQNYKELFAKVNRSLKFNIQFIINQCSYMGIIPNNVFNAYGDRVSTRYKLLKDDTQYNVGEEAMNGVWQIVKISIDSILDNRRLNDNSVANPDGSLYNEFQKICQEPFVEFWGDTFGDQYTIIVRQPPFNKTAILSFLKNNTVAIDYSYNPPIQKSSASKSTDEYQQQSLVIDIEESDIITDSLEFNDSNIFTWYRYTPREFNFTGQDSALPNFPVIFLPAYAKIWGNKKKEDTCIYTSYEAISQAQKDVNIDYFRKAALQDLKYIIDCNSYMPFTRNGSIIINGDRRIKRGTWVRHKGTKEIFYVDAVSQSFSISSGSIERITTLSVSRGMIERFVYGSSATFPSAANKDQEVSKAVSYFDVVNTDYIIQQLTDTYQVNGVTKNKSKLVAKGVFDVDPDIFNFFLNRLQFDPKYNV